MIVMYLLIIVFAIALWFLLAFIFFPMGKFFTRIWKDAIDEMNRDDNKENNNEEKEKS